jgi:hypothetical protein
MYTNFPIFFLRISLGSFGRSLQYSVQAISQVMHKSLRTNLPDLIFSRFNTQCRQHDARRVGRLRKPSTIHCWVTVGRTAIHWAGGSCWGPSVHVTLWWRALWCQAKRKMLGGTLRNLTWLTMDMWCLMSSERPWLPSSHQNCGPSSPPRENSPALPRLPSEPTTGGQAWPLSDEFPSFCPIDILFEDVIWCNLAWRPHCQQTQLRLTRRRMLRDVAVDFLTEEPVACTWNSGNQGCGGESLWKHRDAIRVSTQAIPSGAFCPQLLRQAAQGNAE